MRFKRFECRFTVASAQSLAFTVLILFVNCDTYGQKRKAPRTVAADPLKTHRVWVNSDSQMNFTIIRRSGNSFQARLRVGEKTDRVVTGRADATSLSWKSTDVVVRGGRGPGGDNTGRIRSDKDGYRIDFQWKDAKGNEGTFTLRPAKNAGGAGAEAKPRFPKHLDQSWKLVWEDQFDGKAIDDSKWEHCPEWQRGQTQWSPEETLVDGRGNLLVRIRERNGKFYSGAIWSRHRFDQNYGYFEIRCQIPVIRGGWCAFWMMPTTPAKVQTNDPQHRTEIDIFESSLAARGQIRHGLHWDGYGENHKEDVRKINGRHDLYRGFHTYAVKWSPDEYVFFIDGQESWRSSSGGVMDVRAYMMISIEADKWAGNIHEEKLPKQMLVDYVRVYKKNE